MLISRVFFTRVAGLRALWWLPLLAAASGGCSSAPGVPQPESRSPNVGAAEAAAPASAAHLPTVSLALVSGVESDVAIDATPDASCTLLDPNEAKEGMRLFADDLGEVRFRFQPREAGAGTFQLECDDLAGARSVREVAIRAVATRTEASPPPVSKGRGSRRVRPALTGDLDAYSQADLVARGSPPRPDRARDPKGYARWVEWVSRETVEVPPPAVPHRTREGGALRGRSPGSNASASSNWSGSILSKGWKRDIFGFDFVDTEDLLSAAGDWIVPSVQGHRFESSAAWTWVGVGGTRTVSGGQVVDVGDAHGDGNTSIIQAGTAEETHAFLLGWVTKYYPFAEYWAVDGGDAAKAQALNLAIHPGDEIWATAWSGDTTWYPTRTGAYGWYSIKNFTTNESTALSIKQPTSNVGFYGESVEWIVELPASQSYLANYGSMSMNTTVGFGSQSALDGTLIAMYAGDHLLSFPVVGDASKQEIVFGWNAAQ
jgi:hypothetical protein